MKRVFAPVVLIAGTTLLLAACSKDPQPAAAPAAPAPAASTTTAAAIPTAAATQTSAAASPDSAGDSSGAVPGTLTGNVQSYTTKISGADTVGFQVVQNAKIGAYVADAKGFTLYRFEPDSPHPTKSTCNNACAVKWPPLLAAHKVEYLGLQRKNINSFYRTDGSVQESIGGWPVYRFAKDTAPGQLNGQGVDGNWYAVSPNGSRAEAK